MAVSLPLSLAGCATDLKREGHLGFRGISSSTADAVRVPDGYTATVLFAWGDPVGHPSGSPAFKPDASHTADEQALQAGMHNDGIHYFPLPYGSDNSTSGLLVMNHEYTDDGLLHTDGFANWSADKVRKAQNAHGCSVIEVRAAGGKWEVMRPSRYARRITARPDRALTSRYRRRYFGEWLKPLASIRTSLGCTSRCNFCALWSITNGKYLRRQPEAIVEELRTIAEENVFFCDDESMVDARRMDRLADLILQAACERSIFSTPGWIPSSNIRACSRNGGMPDSPRYSSVWRAFPIGV